MSSIFLGVFFSVISFCLQPCIVGAQNGSIPAAFAFGDSILDTGNNNNLNTLSKCNFSPYGQDLLGGKPTGRFCDGKVPSDLIAEALGIKELLPAYLDPNLRPEDLSTGVCFASGGSGYDSLTANILRVVSMSAQLDLFKEYISKLKEAVGDERANNVLSNGLYLVSAGNNDIAVSFFTTRLRLAQGFPAYSDLLVTAASNFIKELPNVTLAYADVYNTLLDLIQNTAKSGFQVTYPGCCPVGLAGGILCHPSLFGCADVSKYVFWDAAHPTERAYKVLVAEITRKFTSSPSDN
ncbi:hypothetical protein CDL15_Pgr021318 [Punica granatum]|uniref:GDSL esterase/lipase EXL3-like n=1 Tax=Punica granatum TaxID=22663 RepID=A0A218WQ33_PUNGR|nr:hypothetical protein CDL15_Pgr021318 [Punica granatum]PKI75170.1 hypothetical protein CRG98_004505 [Punica granatum]